MKNVVFIFHTIQKGHFNRVNELYTHLNESGYRLKKINADEQTPGVLQIQPNDIVIYDISVATREDFLRELIVGVQAKKLNFILSGFASILKAAFYTAFHLSSFENYEDINIFY